MIIETKNLTKRYGEAAVVDNVNLHIKEGRIYGLLGRNGAGKTTIMKMILGLTTITSGQVRIMGKPLKNNEKYLLPKIGSLIESPGFYPNLTGTENLKIFASLRGIRNETRMKDTLDVVGLAYKDKKLFQAYSLGMKQRLAIALSIMHNPDILILDEPINGLDPIRIAEIRKFIKNLCVEKKKTILISSHILSEVALIADDIGIIDHGRLLEEGSLEELKNKSNKYLQFMVSDAKRASEILKSHVSESTCHIIDSNILRIDSFGVPSNQMIDQLVREGISVYDAHLFEESLEDYFKRITGGVGIA